MTSRTFVLVHSEARQRAAQAIAEAPSGNVVKISEPTRNLDQNAALWPLLEAFSEQKQWQVNGAMCQLSPEDWKDLLSASFRREQMRMTPLIGGSGMVMLGVRTSKMTKSRFSEFLDYIGSVASDLGVQLERVEA
jgi:hypothetical protein